MILQKPPINYITIKRKIDQFEIDVTNWRFMRHGRTNCDGVIGYGTLMCIGAADKNIFIPNVTLEQTIEMFKEHIVTTHFEIIHGYYSPPLCIKCWGKGKFDWVERTTWRVDRGLSRFKYVRDQSIYYTHPDSEDHIFAKTKLNDGDMYCPRCKGFGLNMDGRHRAFKLKGMKRRLIKHSHEITKHYNINSITTNTTTGAFA